MCSHGSAPSTCGPGPTLRSTSPRPCWISSPLIVPLNKVRSVLVGVIDRLSIGVSLCTLSSSFLGVAVCTWCEERRAFPSPSDQLLSWTQGLRPVQPWVPESGDRPGRDAMFSCQKTRSQFAQFLPSTPACSAFRFFPDPGHQAVSVLPGDGEVCFIFSFLATTIVVMSQGRLYEGLPTDRDPIFS